jgi:DNA-binding NarL/FixJ family response regulator
MARFRYVWRRASMNDQKPTWKRGDDTPPALRAVTFRARAETYLLLSFALPAAPCPRLTAAEDDVLQGILAGCSNAEIARSRGTALRTVANQVSALFGKFRVSSRLELAREVAKSRKEVAA